MLDVFHDRLIKRVIANNHKSYGELYLTEPPLFYRKALIIKHGKSLAKMLHFLMGIILCQTKNIMKPQAKNQTATTLAQRFFGTV